MSSSVLAIETGGDIYAELMGARRGDPVEDTLARMLTSWNWGDGAMPDWLGLSWKSFYTMMGYHFPGFPLWRAATFGNPLDAQRSDEMEELRELLRQNRTGRIRSELWMVDILAAGCMGDDHLWQDLGLWERSDLSQLMLENFEPLALRNHKDMKWKKFLYKQLCETEGIYTCRAPSCEVCADYQNCFGPEE
ncbi:MAG: nitrogen fixation protein NifQ [Sedimenticola sp.]